MTGKKPGPRESAHWMSGDGPSSDIVLSSRVRLARNIKGIPFPSRASKERLSDVLNKVREASRNTAAMGPLDFLLMQDIGQVEAQLLVEQHLVSPQHTQEPENKAIVLNRDRSVSIMVNEEDHIRIQAILPGFQVEEALKLANLADDALEENLDYAFHEHTGYLCCCPTNVGTGLRASVMLHLPGLAMVGVLGQVLGSVSKLGLTVRGIYGEGTEANGNVFQVSNQVTIGRAEEEIISHLKAIARQIMDSERGARTALASDARNQVEDRVYRSYGVLTNARMMTSEEAMRLLSDVKLGADMGIVPGAGKTTFTDLMVRIMPAHMHQIAGRELSPWERDTYRATLIRERLKHGEEGV